MGESRFNGKTGEYVRDALKLALAAVIAYFTALGAIQQRVAIVETRTETREVELQRRLSGIERQAEQTLEAVQAIKEAIARIEATGQDRATGEPYSIQRRYGRER